MIENIIANLRRIRESKGLSQELVADRMEKSQSSYARIERGATKIDLDTLWKFSEVMGMSMIDVISYPDKMIVEGNDMSIETTLQVKLKKAKRDEVLKIVFGEKDLELLK